MVNAEDLKEIWEKAPDAAYHWERFPNGKCVWHCRGADGKSFNKKAPDFPIKKNAVWRDADRQVEADRFNASLAEEIKKRNIVLL